MEDQHIVKGPKVVPLFVLSFAKCPCYFPPFISCNYAIINFEILHKHLGHPNSHVLHDLLKYGILHNKESPPLSDIQFDCNSCKPSKSKILPFPTHQSNVKYVFDMIHGYLWGMARVVSHAHYKYFVIFINDYSHFTWVHFFCTQNMKSCLLSNFLMFMFKLNFLHKLKLFGLIMG